MNTVLTQSTLAIRKHGRAHVDDLRSPVPRWLLSIAAASLSAGILMAAVVPSLIISERGNSAPTRIERVSIEQRADAMPLYELPPVFVEANRRAELAKISREQRLDAVTQARSKISAKPPA